MHSDHLGAAPNIQIRVYIPSPDNLLRKLSILEKSKEIAEDGQSIADKAKVIAYIFKQLVEKGSLDAKNLGILQKLANKGGNIALVAEAAINVGQAIMGETTPGDCAESIAKLGFVWGVGLLGEAIGGPIGGFILSSVAEKVIEAIDNSASAHPTPPTPPGYENIELNMQNAFH